MTQDAPEAAQVPASSAPDVQQALSAAERRYRQLALSAGDLVTLHAPDRTLLAAWTSGGFPSGQDPAASIGCQLQMAIHPDDRTAVEKAWRAAESRSEPVSVAYRIRQPSGQWAWVESRIQALRDDSGALLELQTVNRDITEQRAFQHELAVLALRDPLTGLANRLLFGDRLRAAVARLDRRQGPIAVLLLDVDRFKGVNDSLGHSAGDRLLTQLGERLTGCVRSSDTVARLSGDEFAVLAEDLETEAAATKLAERMLAALQLPYDLEGGFTVTVTPSIGMTLSSDPQVTPEQLLREADVALYAAKTAGRNRIAQFDMPLRRQVNARKSAEQRARQALAVGDVRCEYQPVIDLADGTVVLAETRVSLGDGEGGAMAPAAFLPVCEDTGLIVDLDHQVIARVLSEITRIRRGMRRRCPVISINVSVRTLTDPRFPDTLARLLAEHDLEGGGLALEVTERNVPLGGTGLDRTVARLAEMGVGIGLDSFGTGSGALSTLTTLGIDYVTFDPAFLPMVAGGAVGLAVGRAVVDLTRALGLATIAQGVETPEQVALLADLGCGLAQGPLLAAPAAMAELPERILVPRLTAVSA